MNSQTELEAVEWMGRLDDIATNERSRRELLAWLQRSPVHVEVFLEFTLLRESLRDLAKKNPEIFSIESAARTSGEVMTFPGPTVVDGPANEKGATGFRWLATAAASIAIVTVFVLTFMTARPISEESPNISTTRGEQRSLLLPDGSRVTLNTDSSIRIAFSDTARHIDLIAGEVMFNVASNPLRPFKVMVGKATIEAIGTQFNVYRQTEETEVVVLEGKIAVKVDSRDMPTDQHSTAHVAAGQVVTFDLHRIVTQPRTTDVENMKAWPERKLMFDNKTIEFIASEFNRYNHDRIVIADAELAKRQITGVFDVDEADSFVAMLASLERISVTKTKDELVITRAD